MPGFRLLGVSQNECVDTDRYSQNGAWDTPMPACESEPFSLLNCGLPHLRSDYEICILRRTHIWSAMKYYFFGVLKPAFRTPPLGWFSDKTADFEKYEVMSSYQFAALLRVKLSQEPREIGSVSRYLNIYLEIVPIASVIIVTLGQSPSLASCSFENMHLPATAQSVRPLGHIYFLELLILVFFMPYIVCFYVK